MKKYLFKTHRTIKPTFWEIIKRFSTSTSQSSADKALPFHNFIDFSSPTFLEWAEEKSEKKNEKNNFHTWKKRYKIYQAILLSPFSKKKSSTDRFSLHDVQFWKKNNVLKYNIALELSFHHTLCLFHSFPNARKESEKGGSFYRASSISSLAFKWTTDNMLMTVRATKSNNKQHEKAKKRNKTAHSRSGWMAASLLFASVKLLVYLSCLQ